jgi:tRNA(fMet)-specific endonuclease VapC
VYVLDSNTLVYYFKGLGKVLGHLRATRPRDVAIPVVVLYELEVGIAKSTQPLKRRMALDALLQTISVLPFDEGAARAAAQVRVSLERKGTPIGPIDTLIAGIALNHHATLVTHNRREFARVPGLKVVDWY